METGLQKKADTTELEKLQKRVEELEDKYNTVPENSQEGKTWAEIKDISEKRTVEEVIEKSLKNRVRKRTNRTEERTSSYLGSLNQRRQPQKIEKRRIPGSSRECAKTY